MLLVIPAAIPNTVDRVCRYELLTSMRPLVPAKMARRYSVIVTELASVPAGWLAGRNRRVHEGCPVSRGVMTWMRTQRRALGSCRSAEQHQFLGQAKLMDASE